MVCLRSLEEMRNYWRDNRDSLLEKYSDGFLVITYMPAGHAHFETREKVYENLPSLRRVANGEILFGTLPMLIDVREELDSERNNKNRKNVNHHLELLKSLGKKQ